MTPEEYKQELQNLVNKYSKLITSVTESLNYKSMILQTRNIIKEAHFLRKELVQEIKKTNNEYIAKRASAGLGTSIFLSGLFGRSWGGVFRADSKRNINLERASIVAEYENVKLLIDKAILTFEKHIFRFDKLIKNI